MVDGTIDDTSIMDALSFFYTQHWKSKKDFMKWVTQQRIIPYKLSVQYYTYLF